MMADGVCRSSDTLLALLEVRAHIEAFGAQVARMQAHIAQLDTRVAALERSTVSKLVRAARPTTAARAPETLLGLSNDVILQVLADIDTDDELAVALTCRRLRDLRAPVRPPLKTSVGSLLRSASKLRWGVAACGAPTSVRLCVFAARRGDLMTLRWLRAHGCPWTAAHDDDAAPVVAERAWADAVEHEVAKDVCAQAALCGHAPVLRWLHLSGCPWDQKTCAHAALNGQLAALQTARANGCPWDAWTCAYAARGGHLAVLQWARANGCAWDSHTCSYAARVGHLAVLQWARAKGCAWYTWTCSYAAWGGHLAVLQWARAHYCPWNATTCAYAALGGHLAVLQWARARGCPWDAKTRRYAARGGHLAVLQWAGANGCP